MTMRRLVATRWALPAARGAWAAGAAAGGAAWASGEHSMARAAPWASIWRRVWRVPAAAGGAGERRVGEEGRSRGAPCQLKKKKKSFKKLVFSKNKTSLIIIPLAYT